MVCWFVGRMRNMPRLSIPTTVKKTNHLPWLDSVRGLAALYVVIHHIVLVTVQGDQHSLPLLPKLIYYAFSYGRYAVALFIVVSGFSLMIPVVTYGKLRGDAFDFYWRRARRIIPPFYIALVLSELTNRFVAVPRGIHIPEARATVGEIFSYIFMMGDIFGNHSSNYVFWSIAVEWRIYLFFPLLILLFKKSDMWLFALGSVVMAFGLHTFVHGTVWGHAMPIFLALFCFGMVAAEIAFGVSDRAKRLRAWRHWSAACTVSGVVFLATLFFMRNMLTESNEFAHGLVPGVFFALLLVAASTESSPIARVLSGKHLPWLGTFAYSIYLTHAPVLAVVCAYVVYPLRLPEKWALLVSIAVNVPVVLLVAYLFFLGCERPFLSKNAKKKVADGGKIAAGT